MTVTITPSERAADPAWFRNTLGQYPTGVSLITGIDSSGEPTGMVVGSFTSVSLDPPLVAFLPAVDSSSWAKLKTASTFCVNVLSADQELLSRQFAARKEDKFSGVAWHPGQTGVPILDDAVAWIECAPVTIHTAGDHDIVIGQVIDLDVQRAEPPLLFFQGGYGGFSSKSLMARDEQFARQLHFIDRVRPLMEKTAKETGTQVVIAHCDAQDQTILARAGTPTAERVAPTPVGYHFPVVAPVGIWWAAYADDAVVDEWLKRVAPEQALEYRAVLHDIREQGFCLGLASVRAGIGRIIGDRAGRRPTPEERRRLQDLTVDSYQYAPSRVAHGVAAYSLPDVVSVWAPIVDGQGSVSLGVMLSGFEADETPMRTYVDRVRAVAAEMSRVASSLL